MDPAYSDHFGTGLMYVPTTVKSRFKEWNLVTEMKFYIKKSRFSVLDLRNRRVLMEAIL